MEKSAYLAKLVNEEHPANKDPKENLVTMVILAQVVPAV